MNQEYLNVITNTGRPIPGQSLTTDPNNPAPYERPPEFTSIHEASEFLFGKFIEEETYADLMSLLADGMPIMDIVQTTLFTGFSEGKWNPDLMMLLIEPTAYMLLALAERADIDPIIYRGEEEDEADEEAVLGVKFEQEKLNTMKKYREEEISIPKGLLPPSVQQELARVQPPSMMERPVEEPEAPQGESLLAPPPIEEEG